MRLPDFVQEFGEADSTQSVLALMERAATDLGFDKFAYCALTGHDRYEAGENPPPTVAHNFPAAWHDYYFEHGYQNIDPVLLLAPEIEHPFLWDSLNDSYHLEPEQRTVLRQARDFGLRDGVAVPLHGPRGSVCLVTFAAGDGHPDPIAEFPKLEFLAGRFHSAYGAIGRSEIERWNGVPLSMRERQCLRLAARGKSSQEIGGILKISYNAVNYYFKNALHKLGANTRVMAVVKAIRYGLID